MKKEERIDRIKTMMNLLGGEHTQGGFNEYSQFCEELIIDEKFLSFVSSEGLRYIMNEIENTSMLGITRKIKKL